MKKFLAAVLACLTLLGLTACSSGKQEEAKPADTMALSDMMASILTDVSDLPMVGDIPLDSENFEAYAFIPYVEDAEGLVSEAMIGSIAHSVVLVRVPEGGDAEQTMKDIQENANPRKWICVEAEKTIVARQGNTILLVMSTEAIADQVAANFKALWA